MIKNIHLWTMSLAVSFVLSAGLLAQDKVDVSIKVKQDGKVIQDTTYQFDDASEAMHAIRMMEVLSEGDKHMEKYNYTTAHGGSAHTKTMVFISEDGETTEIKEFHGDSLTWVSKEESPHAHGKKVIVMKSDDGNTFDILVDEGGNWTVIEEDSGHDDDVEVEVKVIKEEKKK